MKSYLVRVLLFIVLINLITFDVAGDSSKIELHSIKLVKKSTSDSHSQIGAYDLYGFLNLEICNTKSQDMAFLMSEQIMFAVLTIGDRRIHAGRFMHTSSIPGNSDIPYVKLPSQTNSIVCLKFYVKKSHIKEVSESAHLRLSYELHDSVYKKLGNPPVIDFLPVFTNEISWKEYPVTIRKIDSDVPGWLIEPVGSKYSSDDGAPTTARRRRPDVKTEK